MTTKEKTIKLKRKLLAASVSVMISALALCSSTYAWYVSNHSVEATSSTISAMANGMVLQIVAGTVPNHGKDEETIAFDQTDGHRISPSSSEDLENWYVPDAWSQGGIVSSYQKVRFQDVATGEYKINNESFYAYVSSVYTLYTIRDTGFADVYLDGSVEGGAIQVTTSDGDTIDDKVAKSMRVGISTVDRITGEEELKIVYAPSEPTGTGNDDYSITHNLTGWITVENETQTKNSTYLHIYDRTYVDQENNIWAATKTGGSYIRPTGSDKTIAEGVDYNGIIMKVYIWLEGTDSDCVNTQSQEVDEDTLYDVTVYLAGIAS